METKELIIGIDTIQMQSKEKIDQIYMYRDFNRKKTDVFINDEVPVKLNIEKLAKKRLNIKDYWNDVLDVFLKIENNNLKIIYELEKK